MRSIRRARGRVRPCTALAAIVLGVVVAGCEGPFPQSTFRPTTEFSADLNNLFLLIFGLAVIVFLLVESALLYTVIRFRARPGAPDPKPVHGHTTLEIAWTLTPAFIIALIAIPTLSTLWEHAADAPADALAVEVTGRQWWWEFRYPEYGIVTANELHLPQGRPVELQMTSADVIHSFWAPGLSGKRDVIMGRTNRLVFQPDSVGEYMGQCAEFCGASHANMRMRVFVDSPEDFASWVAAQSSAPPPADSITQLAQRGLEIFRTPRTPASHSCIACHRIDGVSFGVVGPNLTHVASRTTIAGGVLANTPANLERWLRDPAAIKPGQGMISGSGGLIGMPNTNLTEEEITALVAYLQTLR